MILASLLRSQKPISWSRDQNIGFAVHNLKKNFQRWHATDPATPLLGDEVTFGEKKSIESKSAHETRLEEEENRRQYFRNLLDKKRFEAFEEYMLNCNIIFATMVGSAPDGAMSFFNSGTRNIDVAVVDEVSQALEVPSFIPIIQSNRCVLAGDIYQLPPTITIDQNSFQNEPLHLLDRADRNFGDIFSVER